MNTYVIRVNTINNLYADYIIEADTLVSARKKARKVFFRDFPNANEHIRLSLEKPTQKIIKEVMKIINGGK